MRVNFSFGRSVIKTLRAIPRRSWKIDYDFRQWVLTSLFLFKLIFGLFFQFSIVISSFHSTSLLFVFSRPQRAVSEINSANFRQFPAASDINHSLIYLLNPSACTALIIDAIFIARLKHVSEDLTTGWGYHATRYVQRFSSHFLPLIEKSQQTKWRCVFTLRTPERGKKTMNKLTASECTFAVGFRPHLSCTLVFNYPQCLYLEELVRDSMNIGD